VSDAQPALPPAQYFNLMKVSHTPREFFLDFAQYTGEEGALASLVARLVTSPEHVKSVIAALQENVRLYEASYGTIETPESSAGMQ
jgi:hypothetical protein